MSFRPPQSPSSHVCPRTPYCTPSPVHKLPPGTKLWPDFLISSFLALTSSISFACPAILPSLVLCSSSAASSQTMPSQPYPSHLRQSNIQPIPNCSNKRPRKGRETYSVYSTWNTPSTSPRSDRNPPASAVDSLNCASVARGCILGRALLRWARRNR
jgi:hypothetical protein